jgi:hypothetical protein
MHVHLFFADDAKGDTDTVTITGLLRKRVEIAKGAPLVLAGHVVVMVVGDGGEQPTKHRLVVWVTDSSGKEVGKRADKELVIPGHRKGAIQLFVANEELDAPGRYVLHVAVDEQQSDTWELDVVAAGRGK